MQLLGQCTHDNFSAEEAGYEPSESRRRRDATEPGLVAEEKVGDVYEVAKGQHSVIYEVEEEQKSVYEGCEEQGSFRGAQVALTAREVVLRRCGQDEPLAFEECYPDSRLEHCQKIGEGVYGEVFLLREPKTGTTTVVKVIPIEGEALVNGERQKRFDEVLSEMVITTELSALRHGKDGNRTAAFAEVKSVRCAYGRYPPRLLELWELYDETKGSENDSPDLFGEEQLYIVLELANGGKDLEAFVLEDAQQAYSVFKQVACALAVAETALSFEHRDLHWGNILISTVDKRQKVNFNLDGHEIEVSTNGVLVTIIDFTLSRMECDGVVLYDDLERDEELFSAEGDYQFEVYRLMRACTAGAWRAFAPKTNLLWLHYVLDKATGGALRFRAPRAKRRHLAMLGAFQAEVLKYQGAADFVRDRF